MPLGLWPLWDAWAAALVQEVSSPPMHRAGPWLPVCCLSVSAPGPQAPCVAPVRSEGWWALLPGLDSPTETVSFHCDTVAAGQVMGATDLRCYSTGGEANQHTHQSSQACQSVLMLSLRLELCSSTSLPPKACSWGTVCTAERTDSQSKAVNSQRPSPHGI